MNILTKNCPCTSSLHIAYYGYRSRVAENPKCVLFQIVYYGYRSTVADNLTCVLFQAQQTLKVTLHRQSFTHGKYSECVGRRWLYSALLCDLVASRPV